MFVGGLIVLFVMALVWRNTPFQDPNLAQMTRIILAVGCGILGACIPGFLNINYAVSGLAIRATGGMAVFLIAFFSAPDVLPQLHLRESELELGRLNWIEFRAVDAPDKLENLNLDAASSLIVDLKLTNKSDQMGKQIVVRDVSSELFTKDGRSRTYRQKYFVKMITGGTIFGSDPEAKLGIQRDAEDISLRAGESRLESILQVDTDHAAAKHNTSWREIIDYGFDDSLQRVIVRVDAENNGKWQFECALIPGRGATLINQMLDEKHVFPRYIQIECAGETRWEKQQS